MIPGNGRWVSLMLKRPKKKGAKQKMQKSVAASKQVQDEVEDDFEGSETEYGGEDVRR